MKLSQTRQAIVEELLNDVAYYDGDVILYKTNGKVLSEVLTQALDDYTEEILRIVEEELKGMQYNHEYCDDCHYHEALDNLQTYLNDIKEALNDTK